MREFVTSIRMKCTPEQYATDLKPKLSEYGYGVFKKKCMQFDEVATVRKYAVCPQPGLFLANCTEIEKYNPDIFLALAAMSKGPGHYPGEWVKYGNSSHLYQIVRKTDSSDYQFEDRDTHFIAQPTQLTKATKDEIIAWFTKDEVLKAKSEPSGFNPDAGISMNNHSGSIISGCVKPPLGILPRKLHEETRIRDLMAAIDRRLNEGLNIPEKWQDELNDLLYSRVDREVEA